MHLGAALIHLFDLVDVGEIQFGVYALDVHIHGQSDHIHVSGTLAIAEEGGLDALGAGQHAHLSGGHTLATVIVGMEGDDGAVTAGKLGDEVLDLVGKVVGHTVLHGGGEVQDDLVLRGGVEVLQHRLTDLNSIIHFGAHKGLRGILVPEIHPLLQHGLAHLIDEVGGIGGDLGDAVGVHMEDYLPLKRGGGVIEMEDDILGALNGLKGLLDEVRPGLDQHLDGHIIGDVPAVDELTADLVLGLRGRGKANLDLLDADVDQSMEILQLLLQIHGVHQSLVAVPQVH